MKFGCPITTLAAWKVDRFIFKEAALTVIWTVVWVDPLELPAVIVYVVWDETAPGVPEMTPVALFKESPDGNAGTTAQVVTVPVTVGVSDEIACPTVPTMLAWG